MFPVLMACTANRDSREKEDRETQYALLSCNKDNDTEWSKLTVDNSERQDSAH